DSEWESDINEVFDNSSTADSISDLDGQSLIADFKLYKKTLIQQMRLRWEISSLENYVKSKMVPRGLRIKKIPGQNLKKSGGQEFVDKWNNILSECSFKLMQLMIDESTRNILLVNKQVEIEKLALEEKREDKQFNELNENVKKELIKIQQEIKIRKKRKFIRDTEDYKKGQIYALHDFQSSMSDSEQESTESGQKKKQSKNGEKDRYDGQKEKDGQIQLRDRSKWGYPSKRRYRKKTQ
ncbi:hypothetical protein XELAEV_18014366mg, partial [Xenopus laevis]